jgi:hypothetical protein
MSKITVKEQGDSPSQTIVKQAAARVVIQDEKGRSIALQKPGVLAQFRLIKILGETAKNTTYVQMVLPLTYVVEIDGVPVSQPNSEREIDALITRLDEEGVTAVMLGVNEHFGSANAEQVQEEIKN